MIPAFIDKSQIPHKPGVYLFKDKSGRVVYVGKAIDLYHRVVSYFSASQSSTLRAQTEGGRPGSVKTNVLAEQISSVETIIVESELEALILEANLIKKYLPEFNISLKDDKDYLYIKITKEDFPSVVTARIHDLKGSLKYFGPFPSSRTVRETLKILRKVFTWCSYAHHPQGVNTNPPRGWNGRACFYYHLGLCLGACIGKISKTEYRKNIFRLSKLLEGKKENLVEDLVKEMEAAAEGEKFEEALRIKKMVQGIAYLIQPNRTKNYLENPNFLESERVVALEELKKALGLKVTPQRIEGYDISNIQGKEATGSMVVLTNGEIDKSQYRKFKINPPAGGFGRPNDVAMMQEIMRRRLAHPEWPIPDIILVDGGKGQVSGALEEIRKIREFGDARIYGLAKRMEWLYTEDGSIIKLSKHNSALKLLQRIRDEAHRFAINYHRRLHSRVILG